MKKLTWGERIGYGMGDFGNNFSWNYVSSFLTIFLTDVFGIAAGVVSTLFVVARIWDAVNDPVVGYLADRTKTKMGRYRPWILIATPICALFTVLTFWAHPAWGSGAKIAWMYITYCVLVLAYTCVNIPYGTMAGCMTQDIDERGKLTTTRMFFAMLAIGLLNTLAPRFVAFFGGNGANDARGYLVTTIIFACLMIIGQGCTYIKCREVILPTEEELQVKKKESLFHSLKIAAHNREFIVVVLVHFFFGIVYYGRAGVYTYYFKYFVGDFQMMSTYSLVGLIPMVLGTVLFGVLYNKIGSKGKVTALGFGIMAVLCALMYFFDPINHYVFFMVLSALNQFLFGVLVAGIYSIIPDAVEYGQWKSGERNDGFEYAFVSFLNKMGIAIGTAGLVAILGALGYVANVEQTATVKTAINMFMTIIPAILYAVCAVCALLLKVDRKLYAKILADLQAGKTADK